GGREGADPHAAPHGREAGDPGDAAVPLAARADARPSAVAARYHLREEGGGEAAAHPRVTRLAARLGRARAASRPLVHRPLHGISLAPAQGGRLNGRSRLPPAKRTRRRIALRRLTLRTSHRLRLAITATQAAVLPRLDALQPVVEAVVRAGDLALR